MTESAACANNKIGAAAPILRQIAISYGKSHGNKFMLCVYCILYFLVNFVGIVQFINFADINQQK